MCRVRCCDVGGVALHCSADSSTEVGEAAYFLRLLGYVRHTARVRLEVALRCQDGRGNPCVALRHRRRSVGAAGIRAPRCAAGDDAPESRPCNWSGGHGAARRGLDGIPSAVRRENGVSPRLLVRPSDTASLCARGAETGEEPNGWRAAGDGRLVRAGTLAGPALWCLRALWCWPWVAEAPLQHNSSRGLHTCLIPGRAGQTGQAL